MNTFIKDNWFKLSIAVAVLLVAISAGYYFIIFVPNNERSKVERAQDKENKQIQEQQTQEQAKAQDKLTNSALLNDCLSSAESGYSANWKVNCEDVAQLKDKAYVDCIALDKKVYNDCLNTLSNNPYKGQCSTLLNPDRCKSLYGDSDYSANCSLPATRAKTLNDILNNAKDDCFKQYPQ